MRSRRLPLGRPLLLRSHRSRRYRPPSRQAHPTPQWRRRRRRRSTWHGHARPARKSNRSGRSRTREARGILPRVGSSAIVRGSRACVHLERPALRIDRLTEPGCRWRPARSDRRSPRLVSHNTNGVGSRPVMRGLDPRIHRKRPFCFEMMDCRVKPGNDERGVCLRRRWYKIAGGMAGDCKSNGAMPCP
jgi:hypothetical protein